MLYNSFTNRNIINQARAVATAFMNVVCSLINYNTLMQHMYYSAKATKEDIYDIKIASTMFYHCSTCVY